MNNSKSITPPSRSLLVFDTHPIQYRSPVFAALAKKHPHLKVYFFNEYFDTRKWWFHERGAQKVRVNDRALREGFQSEILHFGKLSWWGVLKSVLRLLKQERPGSVVVYGYYLPEHWILVWCCSWLEIPVLFVGETYSEMARGWRRWIKANLRPLFFNKIHRFISIGSKTLSFYRSLQIRDDKITQANYCVDVSFFERTPTYSRDARKRVRKGLRIPENAFVLLFVGRLFDRKRPWDMVEIHTQTVKTHPIHTIMVGGGELESELRRKTQADHTFHLVGHKNQEEIVGIYHASDLLVVTSEYETWGLAVNEAFASGIPALVTDNCGVVSDLVVQGKTGYAYPAGRTDVAVAITKFLIETPEEMQFLAQNAFQRVRTEYSVDRFADAMLTAFSESVGEPA